MRFLSITFLVGLLLIGCGNPGTRSGGPALQSDAYASLIVSDAPTYDYGTTLVGTSLEHQFRVTNVGKFTASQISSSFYLSTTFAYKGGTYPGTGGTCSTDLAAGSYCTIVIVFSPKSNQTATASLSLTYFDGLNHVQTSSNTIKGTGLYSVTE